MDTTPNDDALRSNAEEMPETGEVVNYTPDMDAMDTRTANRVMAMTQEGEVPMPEGPVFTGSTEGERDPSTQRSLHTPGIMPTVPHTERQLGADTSISGRSTIDGGLSGTGEAAG